MSLPQSNCTLTKVGPAGGEDQWRDGEHAAGAAVWEGEVRAYYRQKRREVREGGASSFLVERTVVVERGVPAVEWARELTLTFVRDGRSTPETGTVRDLEGAELDGIPTSHQTTRLVLDPL